MARRPAPPRPAGVAAFAAAHPDRVGFWAWLQFLADDQLGRAEEPLPLLTDLAIGVDPDGADAWTLQDLLAGGVRVGAPPDEFNRAGQDWGLPPFVPHALRAAGYGPLTALWRAALGRGGGLRIDHVMGLFRLYWIPPGGDPADGAYVRYRGDELLAVLAVESMRAGAVVVGEDLGTVEPEVRAALHDAGVLSMRVAWFEDAPPEQYPVQALAAMTTHDLPTVAGVWSGEDGADQRAAGIEPDEDALQRLTGKLMGLTGLGPDSPVEDVVVAAHERLAAAPTMLVAGSLEGALALPLRPNLPGTTDERPNWSQALPVPLADVFADPLVARVTSALHRPGWAPGLPTSSQSGVEQPADLVVADLGEVPVPGAHGPEVGRGRHALDPVGRLAGHRGRLGRGHGHRRHQPARRPPAHHVQRHPHGGAGGHAVVHDHHRPALQRRRLPAAAQVPGPAGQLGGVPAGQLAHLVGGQARRRDHARVQRHPAVVGHRRQRQLLVARDADLAHHQHVERRPEGAGHLGRHRYAAAGQPQHDDVVAG